MGTIFGGKMMYMANAALGSPKQYVAATPGVCGGKPCISGTRIRVWDIGSLAQSGHSPDEILVHFPMLTLAQVHAALAYFYDNREVIEAQIAEDDRFASDLHAKLGPGPLEQKLALDDNSARKA
jgi:uncharacterized protein (DUF433 family)